MTDQPMTADERVLLEHRAAARSDLVQHAATAAMAARYLVAQARYSALPVPHDVERAADILAWVARFIGDQLQREGVEREHLGLSEAAYQRRVELHPTRPGSPPSAAGALGADDVDLLDGAIAALAPLDPELGVQLLRMRQRLTGSVEPE